MYCKGVSQFIYDLLQLMLYNLLQSKPFFRMDIQHSQNIWYVHYLLEQRGGRRPPVSFIATILRALPVERLCYLHHQILHPEIIISRCFHLNGDWARKRFCYVVILGANLSQLMLDYSVIFL